MVQLVRLLELLSNAGVNFVLVGGAAAYAHGSTMVTQDLDLCGEMSRENIKKLARALAPHNPKHRMSPAKPPFTEEQAGTQCFKNLYLQTDIGQIDFLGEIKGIGGYEAVRAGSEILSLPDFSFNILSITKLIKAKEAMGRPRDLEAVAILKRIRNENENN